MKPNDENEHSSSFYQPSDPLDKEPTSNETATSSSPEYDAPIAEPEQKAVTVVPDVQTTPTSPVASPATNAVSPGHIILQWLTYAFWGWTLLGLAWLTFIVFLDLLQKIKGLDGMLPYALASVLVLLPISLVCDIFFSRHERSKKTGISMAVMIVHAVLFALFGIGSLIGAVFSFVQLLVNDGSTTSSLTYGLSFSVITLLYAATFLRTLNPRGKKLLPRAFMIFMSTVVVVFVVLAFVGPFAQARITKNDRLIEENISSIETGISNYVENNKKLPASLSDLALGRDAKQLLDGNLVEYKNEGEILSSSTLNSKYAVSGVSLNGDRTFHYQLCVTYQAADDASDYYTSTIGSQSGDYKSYISTYGHPAGRVCYKVEKLLYDYNYLQPVDNTTE